MATPFSLFDLLETFTQPGCVICNLLTRDVSHYLDSLLYERVTDGGTRREFRAARGLCNEHGWQLLNSRGGVLGITILHRVVLEEVLNIIEQTPLAAGGSALGRLLISGTEAGGALAGRLEPEKPCPACALMAASEMRYVQTFAQQIADPRLETAYRNSDGLCLPHFRQTLQQASNVENLRLIVAIQTAIWKELRDQLQEFEAKHDYRRANEPVGAEGDSWLRAIGQMTGLKGIFGTRRQR